MIFDNIQPVNEGRKVSPQHCLRGIWQKETSLEHDCSAKNARESKMR